eukprot:8671840-Pyramimonas_sp.AAC.1
MNEVLHSKRSKLPPKEKRALRGLCSGAHWCQHRVSKSFNGEPPVCLRCQGCPGTFYHRFFQCDAYHYFRQERLPTELLGAVKRMKQAPGALQTLFCRGILPDPAQARLFFTDGSAFYTDISHMRSAGWSVVVYDHERRRLARYYGAVPKDVRPLQVAKCGEDYAMLMVSRQ